MNKSHKQLFWEQFNAGRNEEEKRIVDQIIDWANLKGVGGYFPTKSSYFSYEIKAQRPILRIWAKNDEGAGDIEVLFIDYRRKPMFTEESKRQDLLNMILAIPTIETFKAPLTIQNRRNIRFSSFRNSDSLIAFLNAIEWAVDQMNKEKRNRI